METRGMMETEEAAIESEVEILIVEDSRTQAEHLRGFLEQENFHVEVATDGQEALSRLRERRPTLVISDVMMPNMDGYELCRRIRDDDDLREIPVILLTSLSDPEDIIKGLECGADNFLTKPYNERALLTRINYILANLNPQGYADLDAGMEISIGDRKHLVTAGRTQILGLLFSSFEQLVQKNRELDESSRTAVVLYAELAEKNKELERQIEQIRRMQRKLLEAERKRVLVETAGAAAHEIGQPLSVIMGLSQMLLRELSSDFEQREEMETILEQSQRVAEILQRMRRTREHVTREYVGDANVADFSAGEQSGGDGEQASEA